MFNMIGFSKMEWNAVNGNRMKRFSDMEYDGMIRNGMELNGIKRFSEKESDEIIWSEDK